MLAIQIVHHANSFAVSSPQFPAMTMMHACTPPQHWRYDDCLAQLVFQICIRVTCTGIEHHLYNHFQVFIIVNAMLAKLWWRGVGGYWDKYKYICKYRHKHKWKYINKHKYKHKYKALQVFHRSWLSMDCLQNCGVGGYWELSVTLRSSHPATCMRPIQSHTVQHSHTQSQFARENIKFANLPAVCFKFASFAHCAWQTCLSSKSSLWECSFAGCSCNIPWITSITVFPGHHHPWLMRVCMGVKPKDEGTSSYPTTGIVMALSLVHSQESHQSH